VEPSASVRARHGWRPERIAGTADDAPVRAGQLARRLMNFGQHWRTEGIEEVEYTVQIPLSFLAELMERDHPGYVEDSIEHPSDHPYEAAQRGRGWPGVAGMLVDPGLLRMSVDWYAGDLLLEWLGAGPPDEAPGFILNTVSFRGRAGDAIVLAGRARRAERPVRYQDA
jgi:hypothetical protein